MNIPKAIEIKQGYHAYYWKLMSLPEREADRLSIEALKRCQEVKKMLVPGDYEPLPGETED